MVETKAAAFTSRSFAAALGLERAQLGATDLLSLLRKNPEAFVQAPNRAAPTGSPGARTLHESLRSFSREHPEDWAFFLPEICEYLTSIRTLLADIRRTLPAEPPTGSSIQAQLTALFRVLHTVKGTAYMVGLEPLGHAVHRLEDLLAQVQAGEKPFAAAMRALEDGIDTLEQSLELLNEPEVSGYGADSDHAASDHAAGEYADGGIDPSTVNPKTPGTPRTAGEAAIRLSPGRLERDLEQIAELRPLLALTQRLLRRLAELDAPLLVPFERLTRQPTTWQHKSEFGRVRRVRAGVLFSRLEGLVRGRPDVRLDVTSAATELGAEVLEGLTEPLLHLVRNALAHGAEPEAVRLRAGKAAFMTLSLRAAVVDGGFLLEVEDDGPGVATAALRAAAVKRGLYDADAAEKLSETAALKLMFVSGLSTVPEVGIEAGRGVGMDAAAAGIARLSGTLEVDSEPGRGTRFQLRVPRSRRVLDALLVGAGEQTFALPLGAVQLPKSAPAEALTDARLEAEG